MTALLSGDQARRVSSALTTLGVLGFWVQLVFLIAVVILGGYVLRVVGGSAGTGNVLSLLGLALPVFTTIWCRRYAAFGRALAGSVEAPSPAQLRRALWIGVWAGVAGTVVAILSLFGAASALLVTMLANPQVGIQVSPTDTGVSPYTISAIDAVSIMALLLMLTAELLVVTISLRLVFIFDRAVRSGATT